MSNNNNKNVTLTQLTTMDTTVKNYIQSKDGDLVGLLTADKSNLTNAIKEINNGLNDVNTTATAIDTTVDGIIDDTTIAVSLVESEDTVEINGENLVCKTYAISQNNAPIATINVPIDLSVEEGAVISETDDNTGETTTYLKFKTTGASDYNLSLDVSSLVSGFSVQQDGILTLESGEITGELEDGSIENSNIADRNITEEKLSLGLQEKLAKEGYAERDVDILDGEKDSLLALHKDEINVITSGTRTTLNDWIKETVAYYYSGSENYPMAVKINNDTWVSVDKQNNEVVVKNVITEEETKNTTTTVPDWNNDDDWNPSEYTFPDINEAVYGSGDIDKEAPYYPILGYTIISHCDVIDTPSNTKFNFIHVVSGISANIGEDSFYAAVIHKIGEDPIILTNSPSLEDAGYCRNIPGISKEELYQLAVAMLMCNVETVGSIPNQEDMTARTIYTIEEGSYSYVDYATDTVVQTTDLNTAYSNITPPINTLTVGRTYKNYKYEDNTDCIGRNYQNSQIGENGQLENGYAVKLVNEEDDSETLFKLVIPTEVQLKYPQGHYTLLSELLPTLVPYDSSKTQGISVNSNYYFKYDGNGELTDISFSDYVELTVSNSNIIEKQINELLSDDQTIVFPDEKSYAKNSSYMSGMVIDGDYTSTSNTENAVTILNNEPTLQFSEEKIVMVYEPTVYMSGATKKYIYTRTYNENTNTWEWTYMNAVNSDENPFLQKTEISSGDLYAQIPSGVVVDYNNPYGFVNDIKENEEALEFTGEYDVSSKSNSEIYTIPEPYWQRVTAEELNGKMTVAEEIAENIGDIPLATTTANGLMPKENVIALDGTYIDTVNNELYIKGQKVMLNSVASDGDIDDLINEIFGQQTTGGLTTYRVAFRDGYDETYPTYVPNIIYSVGELIEVKDSSVIITSQIIANFLQDMKDYYQQQYGEEEDFTLYGFDGFENGSKILKLNDGYGHSGYWSIYKDTTTGKYYVQGSPYVPDYDKTVEAGCKYGSTDVMLSTVDFTDWINKNMQEGYFDYQQMNFVLVELPEGGYTVAGRRNGCPGAPDPGSNYSLPECCKVESV